MFLVLLWKRVVFFEGVFGWAAASVVHLCSRLGLVWKRDDASHDRTDLMSGLPTRLLVSGT